MALFAHKNFDLALKIGELQKVKQTKKYVRRQVFLSFQLLRNIGKKAEINLVKWS